MRENTIQEQLFIEEPAFDAIDEVASTDDMGDERQIQGES